MRKTHTNFQECVNQALRENVTLWEVGGCGGGGLWGGEVGRGERMQIISFISTAILPNASAE